MSVTFRCLFCRLLLIFLALAALPALALETAPIAQPAPSLIWDAAYLDQQGSLLEAGIKARLADKTLKADPGATAGMDDYDVTWYDLVMDIDTLLNEVIGTTTIRAVVTGSSLNEIDLHLAAIHTVTEVRSAGLVTVSSQPSSELLTVTLDRTYLQGEVFEVEVDYHGDPSTGARNAYGWSSAEGDEMIWTLSEPYGARDWWPCKDLNTDKADSIDLHITVPDPLIVASNGLLTGQTVPVAGRTTYHWSTRYPTPTYLVSLAIHPYQIINDIYVPAVGDPMQVVHYSVPAYGSDATAGYAVTIDMITAFAAAFGEYPFVKEKYGHAHFPWGGGMEHQTCTSMLYWYYGEHIIAHELAHQWWGDMITCADFHHIWLNEGFARWCEAYWEEASNGQQAYRNAMNSHKYLGSGTVYVEDTEHDNIFDGNLTYDKASWVVHMLRFVLGEQDFFDGLAAYRAAFEMGSATTEEFQAVLETSSGRDLSAFFQQWIYGELYPTYALGWAVSPSGTQLNLSLRQTQLSVPIFDMPIEVRVVTDLETVTHRLDNSQAHQWYSLPVNGTIQSVELDPDDWVLCTKTYEGVSGVPAVSLTGIVGNTPNPFNPRTTIAFNLAAEGQVNLEIFDLAGRRVRTLMSEVLPQGPGSTVWDGTGNNGRPVAAGIYFARLRADGVESLHKLSLVK